MYITLFVRIVGAMNVPHTASSRAASPTITARRFQCSGLMPLNPECREDEIAEMDGVSLSTVKRDWTAAKLWL